MNEATARTPLVLGSLYGVAALLTAAAVVGTLPDGAEEGGTALAFGALIAVGELARCRTAGGGAPGTDSRAPAARGDAPAGAGARESTPLAAAGALAYALLDENAGRPAHHSVLQVITVVVAAVLAGSVPHVAAGRGLYPDRLARRVLTVAFAALCAPELHRADGLGQQLWGPHWSPYPLLIVVLLAMTALCDAVLAAVLAWARTGRGFGPLLRTEVRALPGIGSAVIATGAVMSLGVAVAGLWALPLFSLPLLLTQLSFRRCAAVRATYRQTVSSLARATEIAGCTPAGHAHRVAALSRAVGRDLGLSARELTVLEYAALLHDTGQLALLDPVPAGATARLAADEQRRIARLGGAVVRRTGTDAVAAAVATVVERLAEPYQAQPLPARIVRTANAYDEMARAQGPAGARTALERLRRRTAGDYQPEVVEALARVLARDDGACDCGGCASRRG